MDSAEAQQLQNALEKTIDRGKLNKKVLEVDPTLTNVFLIDELSHLICSLDSNISLIIVERILYFSMRSRHRWKTTIDDIDMSICFHHGCLPSLTNHQNDKSWIVSDRNVSNNKNWLFNQNENLYPTNFFGSTCLK
jgi:hypothetical protein